MLVGSNPLPKSLVGPTEIALVYTRETEVAKDRLKRAQTSALPTVQVVPPDPFVADDTCATTVRRAIDGLLVRDDPDGVWLNFTGGTKVMAFSVHGEPEEVAIAPTRLLQAIVSFFLNPSSAPSRSATAPISGSASSCPPTQGRDDDEPNWPCVSYGV